MTLAFWDTSALLPLCVRQKPSAQSRKLLTTYDIAVWWATPVEMRSALERLLRMGELAPADYAAAGRRIELLRRGWRELQPTEALRSQADILLQRYPLKAADALQLAAAWAWCSGDVQHRVFISGDAQLLEAARQVGFDVVAI